MSKVKLRLFHELRTTVGTGEVQIEARRLGDVVDWLTNEHPQLRDVLFYENGKLRNYALFYVNNRLVNPVDLERVLVEGDIVLVVPPALGGRTTGFGYPPASGHRTENKTFNPIASGVWLCDFENV